MGDGDVSSDYFFNGLFGDEVRRYENFEFSTIPWLTSLPDMNGWTTQHIQLSFQTLLAIMSVNSSIPRYLAKKYHAVDATKLMEHAGEYYNYVTLQSMFAMHNETFGVRLMKKINDELTQCNPMMKSKKVKKPQEAVTRDGFITWFAETIAYAYGALGGAKPILPTDLCSEARDFLLEPCILIQLPWKPAVLQQWLLGGLAEVLMFERESSELRHWPIHETLFECASQLLALVRDLKSRIVLGFAILGQMVHTYPDSDSKFHQYLLEDVVLPSVPVLNFLISSKAHHIVKNIKKKCSEPSPKDDDMFFVPPLCYTMNTDLEEFHAVNFCSFFAWTDEPLNVIFPDPEFNIQEMVRKLKSSNPRDKFDKYTSTVKPLTVQELKLLQVFVKHQTNPTTRSSKPNQIENTILTIDVHLIRKATVSKLTAAEVSNKFNTPRFIKLSGEIRNLTNESKPVVVLRHSLLFQEALNCRAAVDFKTASVLKTVFSLQLHSLEREQKIRLTYAVTEMFDKAVLSAQTVELQTIISVDEMSKQISKVHTQIENQSPDSVHSQLPAKWVKPVKQDEQLLKYQTRRNETPSNCKLLTLSLEDRIGRLLYNISKTNFKVVAKGGYPFPHFSIVQHLLPCFVTFIIDGENLRDCEIQDCMFLEFLQKSDGAHCEPIMQLRNIIKLVHNLIKHYEESFIKWSTECKSKTIIPIKTVTTPAEEFNMLSYYRAYCNIILKYREFIRYFLLSHIEDSSQPYTVMLNGFDQILNLLPYWPLVNAHKISSQTGRVSAFMICMDACLEFAVNFSIDLMKICEQAFKHPTPGHKLIAYPELSQLHEANVILCELESVFFIACVDKKEHIASRQVWNKTISASDPVREQHKKIHRAVTEVDRKSSDYKKIVKEGTKTLLEVYNTLKSFRSVAGSILKFPLYEKLPHWNHPLVRKAVQFYMNGNLDALDKMLTIFKIPYVKKCRHCGTTTGELMACEDCVKQNFPDVNYFCSKKCREARWKLEHMEQHLDFELGLSDYQQPQP